MRCRASSTCILNEGNIAFEGMKTGSWKGQKSFIVFVYKAQIFIICSNKQIYSLSVVLRINGRGVIREKGKKGPDDANNVKKLLRGTALEQC